MNKPHITSLKYFYGLLILISLSAVIYGIVLSAGESAPSSDIDEALRIIGLNYIKQTVESAENLQEAASKVGVDSKELKRLCMALDIDINYAPQEIKPVEIPTLEKLSNDYFEADVILKFDGLSPYLLLVDKNSHLLHLLHYKNGKRTLINTYECKTGKNHGDKEEEGDNRTPEGVFFFINKYSRADIQHMVGRNKAYQYGDLAFATNFPNTIDRMHGKKGGGIWLHGTDRPFDENSLNDTRGCIVTTNEVINTLSRYIQLYSTPIIIVNKLNMVSKEEIEVKSQEVLSMVEEWRSSWAEKRLDDYQIHYSSSFISQGMNRKQWLRRKRNIFGSYAIRHITFDNFTVFRHNSGMVVQFLQDYSADNIKKNIGIKTLYLVPEGNSWGIIKEQFRKI